MSDKTSNPSKREGLNEYVFSLFVGPIEAENEEEARRLLISEITDVSYGAEDFILMSINDEDVIPEEGE
jgi:hypothetical protein